MKILEKLPENNRLERIYKIAVVDFKKRYYNDSLGLIWALINPLSRIMVYFLVFTRILGRGQKDNFALYLYSGIVIWIAFSEATVTGARLLKSKLYLIENIQFKWSDMYISHMMAISFGFLFNLFAYQVIAMLTGVYPNPNILYLPIILVQWFFISQSAAKIIGVISPIFDDFIHIWSIVILVGFWTSGIFFEGEFYFDNYTWYIYVNPFIGIILNARACLLVGYDIYPQFLLLNTVQCIVLYILAHFIVKKLVYKAIERL